MTTGSPKWQQADALCRRLQAVHSVEEKQVYAEMLDQLYPDVRVRLDGDGRMLVFYPVDRAQHAPKILAFTAHYIEEVHRDGSAVIRKDFTDALRHGEILAKATIGLEAFPSMRFLPRPPPPTVWARLLDESAFGE